MTAPGKKAVKVVTPTHEYVELVPDTDDFLAFWQQHRAKSAPEVQRILGVDVPVPTDMPLAMQDLAEQLQQSSDPADLERLVAMLFGPLVYGQWKANGITTPMLGVLLTWGMCNASGQPTTFEEAARITAELEAGKAPAAANRAARRASSRTPRSARTGR